MGITMKKHLIIISLVVIVISIFVSCSVNGGGVSDGASPIPTTAVTDSNGTTHYYEPITDNKGNVLTTAENKGVFAEIETQSNGKVVTKKNGTYVTKKHTTVLPIENTIDNSGSTEKKSSSVSDKTSVNKTSTRNSVSDSTTSNDADNTIELEITKETKTTATATTAENTTNKEETTTQKQIQPATDKDGWITKWY